MLESVMNAKVDYYFWIFVVLNVTKNLNIYILPVPTKSYITGGTKVYTLYIISVSYKFLCGCFFLFVYVDVSACLNK